MFDIVSAMKEFFSRKMATAKPLRHNFVKFRPTGAALRNPADPIQAARIEAAEARRELRADKAHENADRSYTNNPCIGGCGCERFNPFYINY